MLATSHVMCSQPTVVRGSCCQRLLTFSAFSKCMLTHRVDPGALDIRGPMPPLKRRCAFRLQDFEYSPIPTYDNHAFLCPTPCRIHRLGCLFYGLHVGASRASYARDVTTCRPFGPEISCDFQDAGFTRLCRTPGHAGSVRSWLC
jgi:hypothetical protein